MQHLQASKPLEPLFPSFSNPFPSQKTGNLPHSTNPKQPQSGVLDARDHTLST